MPNLFWSSQSLYALLAKTQGPFSRFLTLARNIQGQVEKHSIICKYETKFISVTNRHWLQIYTVTIDPLLNDSKQHKSYKAF